MKSTNTYEVRIREGSSYRPKGEFSSLEEASKHTEHKSQCTWEDIENGKWDENKGAEYSHIIHYRDGECYNDLYFINEQSAVR